MLFVTALSAVGPTTTTVPHIADIATSGRDWFDWAVLIVGSIAAAGSVLGVILAGVLLFRSRPECQLGPARWSSRSGDRVTFVIDLHIVAGGHWVLKSLDVSFTAAGAPIDVERLDPTPVRGVGELWGRLVYEMNRTDADVQIDASLRFRHGGKSASYRTVLPHRW